MKTIDPDKIKVILATDCGSTTTKAILIQYVDGEYRQTHRGEAPSTVEAPFADVTIGIINSVTEVAELPRWRSWLIGGSWTMTAASSSRQPLMKGVISTSRLPAPGAGSRCSWPASFAR
jgi:hypothetical protein